MSDKIWSMRDAIAEYVRDGDTVALEGFTHLIPFAAGHEIIRQHRRDLTVVRMTPDIVVDQMVAAGCLRKLIFSFAGNSAVGSLFAVRRAVEQQPPTLELEEYSHYGLLGRYIAGASGLPFFPIRSYAGSDMPSANPLIRRVRSPYEDEQGDEEIYVVPPINPDVAILHAQRADKRGNVQAWGILGPMQEVAFAARRTIVVVEDIVDDEVVRSDPNRTVIPAMAVDAVVHAPYGAHPSFVQGSYDRDNRFYRSWSAISKDPQALASWLDEWIYQLPDADAYVAKLGAEHLATLRPTPALSEPVDYGSAP